MNSDHCALCTKYKVSMQTTYIGNFVIAIDNVHQRQGDTYFVCKAETLSYIYLSIS
jgi:hypothetical protein